MGDLEKQLLENFQDVSIDNTNIKSMAKKVMEFLEWHYKNGQFHFITCSFTRYYLEHIPAPGASNAIDWIFVLNTMNFSLWIPNSTKQWTVKGFTGYWGLSAAIKRASNEGKPIWNPSYYSKVSQSELEIIFRSDDNETKIPLIHERVWILHEIGNHLLNNYQGTFAECIKRCNGNARMLLTVLDQEFVSYRDVPVFGQNEIFLYSKAITLIADMWTYKVIPLMWFVMPSTIFVDYRVPQVLFDFGLLRYSDRLAYRFMLNDIPLVHGSREEVEIRSCSYIVTRKLCEEVMALCECYTEQIPPLKNLQFSISILIDNYLFIYRIMHDKELMENTPFHNIASMYY